MAVMAQSRVAVAKGATAIYVANVVVLVANTLYFLILTNILRSTLGVGIVTALNLMIWLLVTVSILAQPVTVQSPVPAPPAVLKFVPELLARKAHSAASRAFSTSLASSALIAVVIGGTLILSPGIAVPFLGGSSVARVFVQLAAVDVILLSLGQVCLASLMSTGDMRRAGTYMILWSVLRYAFASVLLFNYAIEGVLIGWIVGDGILLLIALRRTLMPLHHGVASTGFSFPDFMRYSSYTLLSALLGYAINQADKIFTLAQQGLSQLAIYNVAIVAASFAGMAPYALTMVLLPTLSSLHAAKQVDEMRQMVRQYSRYVSIIVTPIAVGFAAITGVALRIFGPAYVVGFVPSAIVSVTAGLTAVGAVYAAVLLAVGELRWYTAANVLGVASLAAVAYVTTPFLGLSGPAWGRASLMILAALLYAYAAMRSGFFELDGRAFLISVAASAPMGIIVFLILSFFHSFHAQLAMLPVVTVIGALLYLGVLRGLKLLTAQDFEFIQEMAPARAHGFIALIARLAGVRSRR
jgi:O-antigen/teichoic acid export membrane protein